jgi:hypothetical protein
MPDCRIKQNVLTDSLRAQRRGLALKQDGPRALDFVLPLSILVDQDGRLAQEPARVRCHQAGGTEIVALAECMKSLRREAVRTGQQEGPIHAPVR